MIEPGQARQLFEVALQPAGHVQGVGVPGCIHVAPGRHNELYRVFDAPTGLRSYGGGSQVCRILKNTPEEIFVKSEAITYERGGFETTVTTRYRLLGGKPWVEIQPVSQADEQGMHGESRFVLAPEAAEDGSDFVDDSLKRDCGRFAVIRLYLQSLVGRDRRDQ